MPEKMCYLDYLPPVLWEQEQDPGSFSLRALLSIFERVLTGIDDGDDTHESLMDVIARRHQFFDPRYTPPNFLEWLASWVGLAFPKVLHQGPQPTDVWDEAMRRKVTGEIMQLYRQRGLKAGLKRYLDLYTTRETRLRIAIDDGSKLLFARPVPGMLAPVYTRIAQPQIEELQDHDRPIKKGLIWPSCIAVGPDGSLFVADQGRRGEAGDTDFVSSVWRIAPADTGDLPPRLLGPPTWPPSVIRGLAVRHVDPWELVVLTDRGEVFQLRPPAFDTVTEVVQLRDHFPDLQPVALAVDHNDHLLILDETRKRLIDIALEPLPPTHRDLTSVITPLALLVLPNGDLIIGDGRQQPEEGDDDLLPTEQLAGNLVYIDRSNADNWEERLLLTASAPPDNPLVAPIAIVREDDRHVLVLDVGLKPFKPLRANPFQAQQALEANIYRVELTGGVGTPATVTGQFVYPTGMAWRGDTLFICDPGYPDVAEDPWRTRPHEFQVVVHFSQEGSPLPDEQQQAIIASIRDIVAREKPAHTYATVNWI